MAHSAKPIPEGYHALTPYLIVDNAQAAIDFYTQVFGARELFRLPTPDGRIGHAEIEIGDSKLMLADEFPEMKTHGPKKFGGTAVRMMLYVEDVDEVVKRAIGAGAKPQRPVQDQFYGDRSGSVEDPFGHYWHVSTHIEDVSPEEMERRMAKQG